MDFSKSLDLNMRYYHIQLTKNAITLCTIIILLEEYRCKHIPIRVHNSLIIFHLKKMIISKDFNLFVRQWENFWFWQKYIINFVDSENS